MKLHYVARLTVLALCLASASCGSVREGTGTSFLVISRLEAASGAKPSEFAGLLQSDVLTVVDKIPSTFSDNGRVTLRLGLKDPISPAQPTQNQAITIDRYHVEFKRSDGRNSPGVDVPYGFDGAFTVTVTDQSLATFELVRHIAKDEAPLRALVNNPTVISTIAEITFFGRDLTGHEVSVVGHITVDFGDFGDPK